MDKLEGQVYGDYKLGKLIGKGTYGHVYRARRILKNGRATSTVFAVGTFYIYVYVYSYVVIVCLLTFKWLCWGRGIIKLLNSNTFLKCKIFSLMKPSTQNENWYLEQCL